MANQLAGDGAHAAWCNTPTATLPSNGGEHSHYLDCESGAHFAAAKSHTRAVAMRSRPRLTMDVVPDDQSEHKVADRQEYQKREQEHHPPAHHRVSVLVNADRTLARGFVHARSVCPQRFLLARLFTVAQGL